MKLLTRKAYGIVIDWTNVDKELKLLDQYDHKHLRIKPYRDSCESTSMAYITFMMYDGVYDDYRQERNKETES